MTTMSYRGYGLKPNQGQISIWFGDDFVGFVPNVNEAKKMIDGFLNAP